MAHKTVHEQLADALDRTLASSDRGIVRSGDISRSDRELLMKSGYLAEVFKGWYFLIKPNDESGQSTGWYAAFWDFLAIYLEQFFGAEYCLSAVSSLDVHLRHGTVPRQVIVMTTRGGNRTQELPCDTSVLMYKVSQEHLVEAKQVNGLRVMPLHSAVIRLPKTYFAQYPIDAEIALRAIQGTAGLCRILLDEASAGTAGRIVGAYRFLGEATRAEEIATTMKMAGIAIEPDNPFLVNKPTLATGRPISPYAARIEAMFKKMRGDVLKVFANRSATDVSEADDYNYLAHLDKVYKHDAYNSLSIEGYMVTPQLIQKIRDGAWDPANNPEDRREENAFAAKGYLEAFTLVKESIRNVLNGHDVMDVIGTDYSKWYQALFSASVRAGILKPYHLAGFRNDRVFIKGSRHVPVPQYAVSDSMEALFAALREEQSPVVRAVLGHFLFVFIHPYMDGNGRTGRFLMNALLSAGRYPWTIIRAENRGKYMSSLERASCEQDIAPFAEFILQEMNVDWSKAE